MAKVLANNLLAGRIGDVIFYPLNGQQYGRLAPTPNKKRWHEHPKLKMARENALEFGGASKLAARIYSALHAFPQAMCAPYTHNRLAALLRREARAARERMGPLFPGNAGTFGKERPLPAFPAEVLAPTLMGLELSKGAGERPFLNLQGNTLLISNLAATVAALGGKLEFRVHVVRATVRDLYRDPQGKGYAFRGGKPRHPKGSSSSEWIAARLVGDELKVDLEAAKARDPQEGDCIVTIVGVEWRRMTGRRGKHLPEAGTLQVVGVARIAADGRKERVRPQTRQHPARRAALAVVHRHIHCRPRPRVPSAAERVAIALAPLMGLPKVPG